ncbi:hypothetical protein [Halovulum sp. GXIMD14793]
MIILAALMVFSLGISADAQELDTFYEEELGPSLDGSVTYFQFWSGKHLQNEYDDVHEVYVRGDGKLGQFRGILELHCAKSDQSKWLAVGGFLKADSVPVEAIAEVRRQYCSR